MDKIAEYYKAYNKIQIKGETTFFYIVRFNSKVGFYQIDLNTQ